MRRFLGRFTYANVMVTVLAFVVLTGGGAFALAGRTSPAVTAGVARHRCAGPTAVPIQQLLCLEKL
jgi:hypothetical protein